MPSQWLHNTPRRLNLKDNWHSYFSKKMHFLIKCLVVAQYEVEAQIRVLSDILSAILICLSKFSLSWPQGQSVYIVSVLWQEGGPAWAWEKSGGRSPRDFLRAQAIFQRISQQLNYSIVLLGRAILDEMILCIGLAAGPIFSRTAQKVKQYGSI